MKLSNRIASFLLIVLIYGCSQSLIISTNIPSPLVDQVDNIRVLVNYDENIINYQFKSTNIEKNESPWEIEFNDSHKKLFDKTVLPEIKKRKIGIEAFKKAMELQQIYGEEAEKFVVEFENKRLYYKKDIDWVAQYIVNEGYDVASYDNPSDDLQNRFIEVKSYDGDIPYFFWSRNEYNVAKRKKEQYWIYLVNRKKINNNGYEPQMEQNPFEGILKNDDWDKQVDKYIIKFISQR